MEPESSLLCSQEPTTGPYPKLDASVHTFPPCFPKMQSIIIFTSMPRSSKQSLPFGFSNKNF